MVLLGRNHRKPLIMCDVRTGLEPRLLERLEDGYLTGRRVPLPAGKSRHEVSLAQAIFDLAHVAVLEFPVADVAKGQDEAFDATRLVSQRQVVDRQEGRPSSSGDLH